MVDTVPSVGWSRSRAGVPLPSARTTAEAIARALRADIVRGSFSSGQRLPQVEIAKRFGVSTTPVREAFGILQRQGLVRVHAQRGATVVLPTARDLEEYFEIRVALECLAAAHAARRFRPAEAPRLRERLAAMRECRDPEEYVQLNHDFHMAVYVLSGRPRLVELIDQLRVASEVYLQINSETVLPDRRAEQEHEEILAACEANDPEAARAATVRHLEARIAGIIPEPAVPGDGRL